MINLEVPDCKNFRRRVCQIKPNGISVTIMSDADDEKNMELIENHCGLKIEELKCF